MSRTTVPKKIRDFLLIASKHQCSICQSTTVDVHHIIAVSDGGTNDLENLMVVCPNHHREFHQGKLSIDQMKVYRTQWLQQCRVFLEVGIPNEKITKDRDIASNLSLENKIQFIQESSNCLVETLSEDDTTISLFLNSAARSPSEITRTVITIVKIVYRLFKTAKITRCTFPVNTKEKILLGADVPELYSFIVGMKDVDDLVFGKISVSDFWKKISFFRKKDVDITQNQIKHLDLPWMI